MRSPIIDRRCRAMAAFLLCAGAVALGAATAAQADTPAHTDVLFVFDTTGSMGPAISEAQSGIQEAMSEIAAAVPDPQFGLVEVNDYDEVLKPGGFEYGIGEGHPAWKLHVPITPTRSQISEGLLKLSADGGGDTPEAYGRALFESATNPAIGWRAGARGLIVLIADDVPHDDDLNEGIPPELFARPSPFDTGIDPGADHMVGNGDDLDWQDVVLQTLVTEGERLEYVDYLGAEQYQPYWQNWTGRTGGSVVQAAGSELVEKIVEAVEAGAGVAPPSCPSGQVLTASEECVAPPSVTQPPPSLSTPPPSPPSNHFKLGSRISCASGCRAALVRITFDSAGSVTGESIRKALIEKLSRSVVAAQNTLKLMLTDTAIAALNKKGKLKLRARFTFTPNGGSAKVLTHTYTVKLPKKGKKHGSKK